MQDDSRLSVIGVPNSRLVRVYDHVRKWSVFYYVDGTFLSGAVDSDKYRSAVHDFISVDVLV